MDYNDFEILWKNRSTAVDDNSKLTEEEIHELLLKKVEQESLQIRKTLRNTIKNVIIMLCLYGCFFFFFYQMVLETLLSVIILAFLFYAWFQAKKTVSINRDIDKPVAEMLRLAFRRITIVRQVSVILLCLVVPAILIAAAIINLYTGKEYVDYGAITVTLIILILVLIIVKGRPVRLFISKSIDDQIKNLNSQIDENKNL